MFFHIQFTRGQATVNTVENFGHIDVSRLHDPDGNIANF